VSRSYLRDMSLPCLSYQEHVQTRLAGSDASPSSNAPALFTWIYPMGRTKRKLRSRFLYHEADVIAGTSDWKSLPEQLGIPRQYHYAFRWMLKIYAVGKSRR